MQVLDSNKKKVPGVVKLQGYTSPTFNPRIALDYASCNSKQLALGLKPVVFVICLQNYYGYKGFRLNLTRYSSHHFEEEVLLLEGIKMFVVHVEAVPFQSEIDSLKKYNNNTITLVYLFNCD